MDPPWLHHSSSDFQRISNVARLSVPRVIIGAFPITHIISLTMEWFPTGGPYTWFGPNNKGLWEGRLVVLVVLAFRPSPEDLALRIEARLDP